MVYKQNVNNLLTYGTKSSYVWKGKTGVWVDQHTKKW